MAQSNPWDAFPAVGAAPAGPLPSPPDPEVARKAEDQQFQRNADARAARSADREEARFQIQQEREDRRDARQAKQDAMGSVEQTKAKGFLTRGLHANQNFTSLGTVEPRSYIGQKIANADPEAANYFSDGSRQKADQAQREFIAAILRYDSGAAIPPEEFITNARIYFPQPGDGPDVMKQKAEARLVALRGLRDAAGPAGVGIVIPGTEGEPVFDDRGNPVGSDYEGSVYDKDGNPIGLQGRVTDEGPSPDGNNPEGEGISWGDVGQGIAQGAGSMVEAVGDFAGLAVNPINTIIGRAAGYDDYTSDFGTTLRESIGLPDNPNGVTDAIIKGSTGALTGSLAARGASLIANPGSVAEAFGIMGKTPVRDMIAGAGAGAGGEVGKEVGGVPGQVLGTLIGGAGAYYGANKVAGMGAPRAPNPTMKAADRLGIKMLPADVGGTGTRMATGAVGSTLGNVPLVEGARGAVSSAGAARSKVASTIGDATDAAGAGQAAQRGAKEWMEHTNRRAGELFEGISIPADTPAKLGTARAALAELSQGFDSNPALGKLWTGDKRLRESLEALTPNDTSPRANVELDIAKNRLSDLQIKLDAQNNGIANPQEVARLQGEIRQTQAYIDSQKPLAQTPPGGGLSWQDLKRWRTIIGEKIGKPGIASDGSDIAALRKVYAAITSDMEATAAATSPRP